ncbi:disulfide bond formation protein B [Crenobacter sp. SG2305]|uniref:disulfide bond formation protein B n=1 Tax=Crenobacter oryzisoli TaxID=3056844 RepID=UPI0025AB2EFB|nr:disulfide bond formation protein B [Crenobacter sp. SG2305]MDN0082887.1 disulfide bond formation protein B [Crenobacter sp. SG2305]
MLLSRPRTGFFLIALGCAAAMGFALYAQYQMGLEPCPMCIMQRVAVIVVGLLALIAALVNPRDWGIKFSALLVTLAALTGGGVAARQVWLQHLPADQVPACGPGLDYMLETMPMADVLAKVFHGSGECARVDWTFLGQSMPFWSGVFFIGVIVFTWGLVASRRR